MKYLVMECHPGYAVVLDEQGRFLRAANMGYEAGQVLDSVSCLQEVDNTARRGSRKGVWRVLAAAACLCIVLLGTAGLTLNPYGTVRIRINPDVQITVNRLDYVLEVEGLNADGQMLLEGYRLGVQKVDAVAQELTDRAEEMGYLTTGGEIHLTVQSRHGDWQIRTEQRLLTSLQHHTGEDIAVIADDDEDDDDDLPDEDDDDDLPDEDDDDLPDEDDDDLPDEDDDDLPDEDDDDLPDDDDDDLPDDDDDDLPDEDDDDLPDEDDDDGLPEDDLPERD